MSLLTACFSMYSDMSSLIIASLSPKTASARARHSSVLPTPVGPRNRKLPIGRLGSDSPTLPRRIARDTAVTASFWPMTRRWSILSILRRRFVSSALRFATGMPVHSDTTAAISSAVTRPPPETRMCAAASSARSMALSGRNRSFIYRAERSTAAVSAASDIFTPWCFSRPWRTAPSIFRLSLRDGSAIFTGWNLRSSAASFSIWRRYSSGVVAPMS